METFPISRPAYRLRVGNLREAAEPEVLLLAKAEAPEEKTENGKKSDTEKQEAAPQLPFDATLPVLPKPELGNPDKSLPLNPVAPAAAPATRQGEVIAPKADESPAPGEAETPKPPTPPARQIFPQVANDNAGQVLRLLERQLQVSAEGDTGAGRWYNGSLYSDPLVRAAAFNIVPLGDTFLDGLGGIPRPPGTSSFAPLVPAGARVLRLGPATVQGALNLGTSYRNEDRSGGASNSLVGIGPGTGQAGDHYTFVAGATLEFVVGEPATGHFLTVSYSGLFDEESPSEGMQPFNQTLAMLARIDFDKLKLALGISFADLTGNNRDVGGDAERTLFGLSLNASYPIGAKTSMDLDVLVPFRQVSGGIGSSGFTVAQTVNYAFDRKLTLGLGFGIGMEKNEASSGFMANSSQSMVANANRSETFERVFTRIAFQPDAKLGFFGDLGVEFRDEQNGSELEPVMAWGITWAARPTTNVTFTMQEDIKGSSSMAGEDVVTTTLQLAVTQQLSPRLTAQASFGYEHAQYMSGGTNSNRTDDLLSVQVGLGLSLTSRWNASLACIFSDNASTDSQFTFTSTQVQLFTSIAF